jgi:hypothetical protein
MWTADFSLYVTEKKMREKIAEESPFRDFFIWMYHFVMKFIIFKFSHQKP